MSKITQCHICGGYYNGKQGKHSCEYPIEWSRHARSPIESPITPIDGNAGVEGESEIVSKDGDKSTVRPTESAGVNKMPYLNSSW